MIEFVGFDSGQLNSKFVNDELVCFVPVVWLKIIG